MHLLTAYKTLKKYYIKMFHAVCNNVTYFTILYLKNLYFNILHLFYKKPQEKCKNFKK